MTIGSQVTTQHGHGVIVGKDLPDSSCWLWLVRLDDGRETYYSRRD